MGFVKNVLQSMVVRKVIMAFTGLFLVMFLVGHLAGNLQLLSTTDEADLTFNAYAHFMTTNPGVKLLSYATYISVLVHVLYSVVLTRLNKKARPKSYEYKGGSSASWASRNMGILGTGILIFLVIHLRSFWYEMHWGAIGQDANGHRDLYAVVAVAFSEGWYVLVYVLSMAFMGYHLSHGVESAFQTLGLYHQRYTPFIKKVGLAFAILIPFLFALIPVVMYLRNLYL